MVLFTAPYGQRLVPNASPNHPIAKPLFRIAQRQVCLDGRESTRRTARRRLRSVEKKSDLYYYCTMARSSQTEHATTEPALRASGNNSRPCWVWT